MWRSPGIVLVARVQLSTLIAAAMLVATMTCSLLLSNTVQGKEGAGGRDAVPAIQA